MVWAFLLAAAFGDGFCAFHHEGAAERAEVAGRLGFDGVLAVRIVGTGVEDTEASATFHHLAFATGRALHAGRWLRARVFLDELAFRIVAASDEAAEAAPKSKDPSGQSGNQLDLSG